MGQVWARSPGWLQGVALPTQRCVHAEVLFQRLAQSHQGGSLSRGSRAQVRGDPHRHAQGRAVHARLPGDQPQRQGTGHRRWRRDRIRQQRHPALSGREDRQVHPSQPGGARRTALLAHVCRHGVGPFSGQAVHFRHHATEKVAYAHTRYQYEANRHYGILNDKLSKNAYMVGGMYTIVDMDVWGWARMVPFILGEEAWAKFPHLKRLVDEISARPAAVRASGLKDKFKFKAEMDEEARRNMFRHLETTAA